MPLSGIRIIDLSRFVAGPFCSMLLADFGADVIKVEPQQGDPTRFTGIFSSSENPYFVNLNRNKRSMTLNLKHDSGKEVLKQLVQSADVLLENFRPGVMKRLGLGHETLKQWNPDLIYAGITGFGRTGPYRDRPAFDFIAQALSGLMSLNGTDETGPMRVGIPISDTVSGLYTAFGVVMALRERDRNGHGSEVQTALVDSLVSMFTFASAAYFEKKQIPPRTGNDHMVIAPYGVYEAADGPICIAPSDPASWPKLCKALELDHLECHSHFDTSEHRRLHRIELNAIIQEVIQNGTREYWMNMLHQHDIPCSPIYNLEEAFSDPQLLHQKMILESVQPSGSIPMTGFPVKLFPAGAQLRLPSPQLGEHTDEILRCLGYSDDAIVRMRRNQVI